LPSISISRATTANYTQFYLQTNNPKVVVLSVETSKANNSVKIGVGPHRALALARQARLVADVMSLADEGTL